jgi:hypothetical protein
MPEELEALLNAYVDGALTAAQRAKVEASLKRPAVARRLARLRGLDANLRAAQPLPGPEQSRRMWAGIRERLAAEAPAPARAAGPESESWYAFFTRPWLGAWGLGLAGAAAALVVAFLIYPRLVPGPVSLSTAPSSPQAASLASAPAGAAATAPQTPAQAGAVAEAPRHEAAQKRAALARAPKRAVQPASGEALAALPVSRSVPEAGPLAQPKSTGTTEVERALEDNRVDALIQQFLVARQQTTGPVVSMNAQGPQTQGAAPFVQSNGSATVDYNAGTQPVPQESPAFKTPGRAEGAKDSNGFWDWKPAALAMNERNWPQSRVELEAAAGHAGAAAERAFANSALSLLSAPGAPLDGTQPVLPAIGDLRVLAAGNWQLIVDNRLARFSQGVSVRVPGYRADGDSLLLDLTFDRGEFAPGTHFTRVSGEPPARVFDASNQPVSADSFYAPAGADYNVPDRELRLK